MNQNAASHWTEQEKWVWHQITKGKIADFNEHPDGGGELDPKDDTKTWPEFRKLTNRFLNDILFGKGNSGKPCMDSISRTGVQIIGAWFNEAIIDISNGVIERRLAMVKTRFNGPVNLSYVIAKDYINLKGSRFAGEVSFDTINIRAGLFINGALFDNEVNLRGSQIGGEVSMKGSNFKRTLAMDGMKVTDALFMDTDDNGGKAVFEGEVRLHGAQIGGVVVMKGSNFKQELAMDGMKVTGALFMDTDEKGGKAVFEGNVRLHDAQIGDVVVMKGSNFKQRLAMDRMKVTGGLFMNTNEKGCKAVFEGNVRLLGAQIGGQVNMKGSNFKQELAMYGMNVTGHLFMDTDENGGKAVFEGVVRLFGAQIGGVVSMKGSNFKQELAMDRMKVTDGLFMDTDEKGGKALFEGEVRLLGAEIGGQVSMKGSTFMKKLVMEMAQASDFFFTNITMGEWTNFYCLSVKNNLAFGPFASAIVGKINLSHAKVGVLMAQENSWPSESGHVDLTGLTYESIKDITGPTKHIGEINWFDKMLNSQERFTPQPYEQLAKVLMADGYKDKAEDVLYKKRELERKNTDRRSRKFLMWLLERCIGYGYKNSRIVWPITLFVLLGVVVIGWSGEKASESLAWMVSYSLDMLLPIVELDKEFTKVIWCDPIPKYYFYFQQCVGYVLAIFIAAGLSGLTKKHG